MGNIAKNINQSASVALGLALSMMPAEVEAAKTNIHNEAHTAEIELASDMIVGNAHDKVLNVVDSQNPAKNTKSRENLETEPPSIKDIIAQAKDLKGEALVSYIEANGITKEYLQEKADEEEEQWRQYNRMWIARETEIHKLNQMHGEEFKIDVDTDDNLLYRDKSRDFHEKQRRNLAVILNAYVRQKSIPTAEDFAEKPSTIDQKSPAIVKWEKKYEMEIVDKDGRIYVYHNGEKVSVLLYPEDYNGKPTLNLTKDGKMVFTYADNEKDDNIIIYIAENGGMTEKTETSGTSQIYKFSKATLAQN